MSDYWYDLCLGFILTVMLIAGLTALKIIPITA
jgi:hypothetical protein